MGSFRRRRRDGKVQEWAQKTWNTRTNRWDFAMEWRDVPDDAPEIFMMTRDPKTQGMVLVTVEEFEDDGPITMNIDDFIAAVKESNPPPI